jgi:hypothetical protein
MFLRSSLAKTQNSALPHDYIFSSNALSMQEGADDEFGFGIFAADAAHVPASAAFG